ncbi:hypothetical protein HPSH465_1558 [Glaesserella parasuis H465]|nr:hypothetical protein HPSH465_1558 [Glaesserella parasuis H465]
METETALEYQQTNFAHTIFLTLLQKIHKQQINVSLVNQILPIHF